ncbi:MAG: aminodeoxychorismate lyase [Gallionella sp.]
MNQFNMLINGVPAQSISIRDRGLLYGDGVFRTFCVRNGEPACWSLHYSKLKNDCDVLGIICPDFARLSDELTALLTENADAVFKLIVTRGETERGYAPRSSAIATHIWDVSPLPVYPDAWGKQGVSLALCALRLAHQPRLAGIKHLNRLENVLAAAECLDAAEGLMLDMADHVIEGTRSNVFLFSKGCLITPDLSRCGVAGVQRDRVLAYAKRAGIFVEVRDVDLHEVRMANEVFLTNSVFGLWSVSQFEQQHWTVFNLAEKIRWALADEQGEG